MGKTGSKRRKPVRKPAEGGTRKKTAKSPEEEAFTRSLIAHGQAVKLPPDGKLPPGATHELVEDEHGEVRAVRRRFSLM